MLLLDPNIVAIDEGRHGRGIGRWASDTQFFQAFDQARFSVARRRRGKVLLGFRFEQIGVFALAQFRQARFGVLVLVVIIAPFGIEFDETIKDQNLTRCTQHGRLVFIVQIDGRAFKLCRFHLRGNGAAPDQRVELTQVAIGLFVIVGSQAEIGRPDRFVGFLRVLLLGGIAPGLLRQILRAIIALNVIARGMIGFFSHVDAIGPHIGDAAFLVEFLRRLHGALGRETESA